MHDEINQGFFSTDKRETKYGEKNKEHPTHKAELEQEDEHAEGKISEKRRFDENPERFPKGPRPQRLVHTV
jgi:hypothetical protein